MKQVSPYLNFAGNSEKAFQFYQTVFGGELSILRFRDFADNSMNVPGEDLDKIAHIGLALTRDIMLMASDSLASLGQTLIMGNNHYIHLEVETAEEAEKLFSALAAGGTVVMPLSQTEWAEKYGMCQDRFGVQWMIDFTGNQVFEMPGAEDRA